MSNPNRRTIHLWAILGLTILTSLLTWPLAQHMTTHVTGNGVDDPALAWNLWWIKTRLVDQQSFDIFHADWMFHPIKLNLAFYTLTPLNGLLSIPLQTGLSLIIANNLLLIASFVLGGYGTFLLMLELLPQRGTRTSQFTVAFFAAIVYAFASSKLFYAGLGQFNIASSHWIPFCILYLMRMGRSATPQQQQHNGLMAGLFLIFQAWSELTYASFLIIFIAIHFLWSISQKYSGLEIVSSIIISYTRLALIFLLGIIPFLWAMLPELQQEASIFTQGGGFSDVFSADLMGYLMPTRLHPLIGDWVAVQPFSNDVGQHVYIGYVALGLIIVAVITLLGRSLRIYRDSGNILFWTCNLIIFWLLTLGPYLRWADKNLPIPGPFSLLSYLPFFSGNRYPSRYSVMLMLSVAVLAGYGLWILLAWMARRQASANKDQSTLKNRIFYPIGLPILLTLFYLFEHASFPLPITDFRVPAIYERIADYPGDIALLELPTGWRNGARVVGKLDALIMMQQWYQTVHGKRRLGGNTSRNPDYKFQYFTDAPLIGDLIMLMNGDRTHLAPVIEAQLEKLIRRNEPVAPQVLRHLGIELVTVHVEKSPPALLRFVEEALPLTLLDEWHGPDWTGASSTIRLYLVESIPHDITVQSSEQITFADPGATLYLDAGWTALADSMRYATQPRAQLLLDLPAQTEAVQLQLWSQSDQVTVWLNGQKLTQAEIPDASPTHGEWITVSIPQGVAAPLIDELQFDFGNQSVVPSSLASTSRSSSWPIGETGITLVPGAAIVVRSAGDEVGSFAQIYVTTASGSATDMLSIVQDWSLNQRGYNLVALNPQGEVLGQANFDTNGDPDAPMGSWLAQWQAGTIIAGAVDDEASYSLTEEDVAALARLGVSTDLREHFRWSHAFIGVAGAPAGSAIEELSLLQPATVSVGAAVDGTAIYGGLQALRIVDN